MSDRLNELEQDIANKTGLPVEEVHKLDQLEADLDGVSPEEVAQEVDERINKDITAGVDVQEKAQAEAANYESEQEAEAVDD